MKKLTYGEGRLQTQQAITSDGLKCLTIREIEEAKPIGSRPKEWDKQVNSDEFEVILEFKNIESARALQDELNELISIWSREEALVI